MREHLRRYLPEWTVAALRSARWVRDRIRHGGERLQFQCNLCGRGTSFAREQLDREVTSCGWCGSTIRFRALLYVFARAAYGQTLPAPHLPRRPDLSVLGFSDHPVYGRRLARLGNYSNSWYHQEPKRDLADLASFDGRTYDCLVCSDVLEHVDRPVEPVFENLYALLKPGGWLILTVPIADGETTEHFPVLERYAVDQDSDGWVLRGQETGGGEFESRDLRFHGGPGSTLEMRLFGRKSLEETLLRVGFSDVKELTEEEPRFGLVWRGTPQAGHPPGVWTARRL